MFRRNFINLAAFAFSAPAFAQIYGDKSDDYDLIVVGSGAAGLCAAISAFDHGVRKIVVLEKLPILGGTSAISGGAVAVSQTDMQKRMGISDTDEEFFEKNSTDRDLRERMVKWRLEHKEEDYAQKILLEDVRNGGSIRSSDELNKILRRKNETDLLKEELLRRVQDNLKLEFTFFSELRELLPEAQWKSVVEEYISQTGSYRSLRMKLCGEIGEENKIKEIIEKQVENFAGSFCDKYSSVDIASQLALAEKLLKKTDPEYAKNLGKQMVKTLLRNPWKRGGYEALRQIVNGFLSASETKEFLEELVKTYPTRQAMREEFGCRRSERTRR